MPRFPHRSAGRALLLAITAAAGGCRPGTPPSPVLPAAARLAPGAARYALVEHRHVTQQVDGQPIVTHVVTHAVLALTVDSGPQGFSVELVVDSVAVTGDAGIPADIVATTAGQHVHAQVAPTGVFHVLRGSPEETTALTDRLAQRLHDLVPTLPLTGATPEARWDDTTRTSSHTAGIPITIEEQASHRAADWTDVDGHTVLPLDTRVTYTITGEGERQGRWISMAGTGSGHLQRLVTGDGVLALGVRSDTLRVSIELPATGVHIPLTQIRSDTLRRLD